MRYRLAVLVTTLLAVAGCDHKEASKRNLAAGLNHYLRREQPCPGYTAASFPMTTSASAPRSDLEALASVGLLSRSTVLVNGSEQIRYDLTEIGRQSTFAGDASEAADALHRGERSVFCFGQVEVADIRNFTEPAEADGLHVTRVTYTRRLTHQPAWSKEAAIQRVFPNYASAGYEDRPQTSGMILTSEGWRLPEDNGR